MKRSGGGLNLYQKFAITIILIGLVPMVILSTFIANNMIRDYREALRSQYEQAAEYVSNSLEVILDSYNSVSKMPYFYNYSAEENMIINYLPSDNLRQIIYGVGYEEENMVIQRQEDMKTFLKYVVSVDGYINSAHFIARDRQGSELAFHFSVYSTYFRNEELFREITGYSDINKESNKIMLIPSHNTEYFHGMKEQVFTVARNYFDLRGEVGNTPYVGTIFLDISVKKLEQLFRTVKFNGSEEFYVVDEQGGCFYNSTGEADSSGLLLKLPDMQESEKWLAVDTKPNDYGLKVIVIMNTEEAFYSIRSSQRMMYAFVGISVIALLCGSVFFSKRLTRPIHEIMENMKKLESGNFDIRLPVRSGDEIGILAERFNQMGIELKTYINQSYVAQIKQNEAELTALKSQIYPHFLYNTLEIIRMTALEDNKKVPEMIEALSEQIHYLIGPMQDMVPLDKEVDVVRKYVYLLNCRIEGKVQLTVNTPEASKIMVPKLILQPIVENAYIHGLKPKNGSGSILVESSVQAGLLELTVMDNGAGMDDEAVIKLQKLLKGDEPGIKNEYNWQSIGLKNVHDRIRFLYGEQYGIKITSTPMVGTMVRILMPFSDMEE